MSRRHAQRKPLPKETRTAVVESLNHDARGVAHVDGKAVFIDGALPGETVTFKYTNLRRDFAEGQVVEVLQAAPERITPPCPHAWRCGGCSLQHLAHEAQIRHKQTILLEQLRRIGKVTPAEIYPPLQGPQWGYRHKARLSVKYVHKKNQALVGFREKASAFVADIDACPVLHPTVGERLPQLSELLTGLKLREQIPQIEIAIGEERCALVFRIIDHASPEDRALLRAFGNRHGFDMYVQRQGPDSIEALDPEAVAQPSYLLPEAGLRFHFNPTEFTQVNPAMNRLMVNRALELLAPQPGDAVLDLFCGLGNFSLPLARQAQTVVGVEGEAALVRRARENAQRNGLSNVEFHSADLFGEVDDQPWFQRRYDKVLLDPARSGAQEIIRRLPRWAAKRIVYVSCNPSTLARDADILVGELGYRLLGAGIIDMFPHTAHVESIAVFEH